MNQTRVVAVMGLVAGVGVAARTMWWPSSEPALSCPPGQVRLNAAGVATCAAGQVLPVGQAHTVRQLADLNRATADDLALLPGVSAALAQALVAERTRLGRFTRWDEVDGVEGVGPQRLALLQAEYTLDFEDAGLW